MPPQLPIPTSSLRSSLRVLHATDIHFLEAPSLRELVSAPKRLIGCTNLYLLGRARRFSRDVQLQLIDSIAQHKPDLVVVSGDTTTLSLESEYALARRAMQPLFDNAHAFPTLLIPGNHDTYTPDSIAGEGLMRKYFGPWMERTNLDSIPDWQWALSSDPAKFKDQVRRLQEHFVQFPATASTDSAPSAPAAALPSLPVFAYSFLRFLSLNPCVPRRIGSNGAYPAQQLRQLEKLLRDAPTPLPPAVNLQPWQVRATPVNAASHTHPDNAHEQESSMPLTSSYNVLMGHYPVLDGQGRAYEKQHRFHGVTNGAELRRLLQNPANRVNPHMFLHGHVHEGFCDQLPLPAASTDVAANAALSSLDSLFSTDTDAVAAAAHQRQMLIFNPGSSGQSFSRKSRRCAAFNIYTISQGQPPMTPEQVAAAVEMEQLKAAIAAAGPSASTTATVAASSSSPSDASAASSTAAAFVAPRARRSFPAPQSPPPFLQRPAAAFSSGGGGPAVPPDTNALHAVQTILQPSADGQVKYYVATERWLHDGKEFKKEAFPYTSGF